MMDNGEYAQVVAIGLEGAKLGVAVTKEGLKLLAKLTKILWDAYKYRQRTGKIGKKGLLKRDANINFVKIDKQSYRKFRKQARKHGILYTKLPTFSSGDQKFMHIMYHSSAAPRMQSVLDILNNSNAEKMGQMESAEDYMNQSGAAEMSEEELDRELLEKYPKEHRKLQGEISKKKKQLIPHPNVLKLGML
ncbi:MAG: PcfB family protein [Clostridiaceae bacterium]|nr:PcfB family protein [Clostridiaceae bacterium]